MPVVFLRGEKKKKEDAAKKASKAAETGKGPGVEETEFTEKEWAEWEEWEEWEDGWEEEEWYEAGVAAAWITVPPQSLLQTFAFNLQFSFCRTTPDGCPRARHHF